MVLTAFECILMPTVEGIVFGLIVGHIVLRLIAKAEMWTAAAKARADRRGSQYRSPAETRWPRATSKPVAALGGRAMNVHASSVA
jgi:hypothetical protein